MKPWLKNRDSSRRTRRCSRWTCTTSGTSTPKSGSSARLECDRFQRRLGTPRLQPLPPTATANAKIVEGLLPAAVSETPAWQGPAETTRCRRPRRRARHRAKCPLGRARRQQLLFRSADFHAHPFSRVFEQFAHAVELSRLALDTPFLTVVHFLPSLGEARVFLQRVDLLDHTRIAQTFAGKQIGDPIRQHLSGRAELLVNPSPSFRRALRAPDPLAAGDRRNIGTTLRVMVGACDRCGRCAAQALQDSKACRCESDRGSALGD